MLTFFQYLYNRYKRGDDRYKRGIDRYKRG